jgi:integrase/recombinase XerD
VVAELERAEATAEPIPAFLEHLRGRGSAEATVAAYGQDLRHLRGWLGPRRLSTGQLGAYLEALRSGGYAPATIARRFAAVRAFCSWLRASGRAPGDSTAGMRPPSASTRPAVGIPPAQEAALLGSVVGGSHPLGLRDAAMLRVLSAAGPRVSELVGLDLEDLDLQSDYVRIRGRGWRDRLVPFDGATHASLVVYLADGRPRLRRRASAPDQLTPALFVNRFGERLTRQGINLLLHGWARAAGLPADGVVPGALRHAFARRLLAERVGYADLAEVMGMGELAARWLYRPLPGGPP